MAVTLYAVTLSLYPAPTLVCMRSQRLAAQVLEYVTSTDTGFE